MKAQSYEELRKHIGHKISCTGTKGPPVLPTTDFVHISINCETCHELLAFAVEPSHLFDKYARHVGHNPECVCYGIKDQEPANVAVECCSEVLLDYDKLDGPKWQGGPTRNIPNRRKS